jgi:blocked-early-in-transport protein 1
MSEAFERERQNNARLDELSAKVSALRGVTIDIYDSARSQEVIDSAVRLLPPLLPLSKNTYGPSPFWGDKKDNGCKAGEKEVK